MTLTAFTLLATFALGAQLLWLASQGKQVSNGLTRDEMRKHIVWRSFYVNPDDPRGWVPKTSGVGHTVNFRTTTQASIFAGLIAVSLLCALGLVGSVVM